MFKKLLSISIVFVSISTNIFAQDGYDTKLNKKDMSPYYFSPLKISRDHSTHSTLFQPPIMTARTYDTYTGVIGVRFEITDMQNEFQDEIFVDYDGQGYRLSLDLDTHLYGPTQILFHYNIAGLEGDEFSLIDNSGNGLLKSNVQKTVSGNLDLILKYEVYQWEDCNFALFGGASIPVDKNQSIMVSRNFDFTAGGAATYQDDFFAAHLNLGFVFLGDPTAYDDEAEFKHNIYGALSLSTRFSENLYLLAQATIENQILDIEGAPSGVVGQGNLGFRYIYGKFAVEGWLGYGLGDLSHGFNTGFSVLVKF